MYAAWARRPSTLLALLNSGCNAQARGIRGENCADGRGKAVGDAVAVTSLLNKAAIVEEAETEYGFSPLFFGVASSNIPKSFVL